MNSFIICQSNSFANSQNGVCVISNKAQINEIVSIYAIWSHPSSCFLNSSLHFFSRSLDFISTIILRRPILFLESFFKNNSDVRMYTRMSCHDRYDSFLCLKNVKVEIWGLFLMICCLEKCRLPWVCFPYSQDL